MLITPQALKLMGVKPRGVLHIGAHEAEESAVYDRNGWGPVIWVEMLPEKAAALRQKFADNPGHQVIEAACWSSEKPLIVHRAENGQSSSVLEPLHHLTVHPHIKFAEQTETITTKRLDQILPLGASFNFVNIDAQGAELEILKGMGDWLKRVKWAYVEINEIEHYAGCALLPEMDSFLRDNGFVRVLRIMAGDSGWGDALYVQQNQCTDTELARLKMMSRLYHRWMQFRRPTNTPAWDNWQSE